MASPPISAYQLALFRGAIDAASNVGGFGSQYSHVKVLTFQQLWNRARTAGALTAVNALTEDGIFGPNTAAALTHALPAGLSPMPSSAPLVPQWWAPIKDQVQTAASGITAQLSAQVSSDLPIDAPTANANQTLNQVLQPSLNTMQNGQAAANQDVPQGGGGSSSPTSAPVSTPVHQPTALPGMLVQGQRPAVQGATWPWIVGGLSLAALAAVLGWAAYRKSKRRSAFTGKH